MLKFKVTNCKGKTITKFSVKNKYYDFMNFMFDEDFTKSIHFVKRGLFTNMLLDVLESIDDIKEIEAHIDDARVYDFYLTYYE